MYVSCDAQKIKFIIGIAWNLLTLISIPLFFFSGIIGALGIIFIYFVPSSQIIFSPKNINKLLENENAAKVFDICLNNDGDLGKIFLEKNYFTNHLQLFYENSLNLQKIENLIELNGFTSSSISLLINNYNLRINNIENSLLGEDIFKLSKSPIETEGKVELNKLNEYTNQKQVNTKQINCENNTYDNFIGINNKSMCIPTYNYISNSSFNNNLGKPSCLILNEWNYNLIYERYLTTPKNCNLTLSIKDAASKYVQSIQGYQKDSNDLLKNLIFELKKYFILLFLELTIYL